MYSSIEGPTFWTISPLILHILEPHLHCCIYAKLSFKDKSSISIFQNDTTFWNHFSFSYCTNDPVFCTTLYCQFYIPIWLYINKYSIRLLFGLVDLIFIEISILLIKSKTLHLKSSPVSHLLLTSISLCHKAYITRTLWCTLNKWHNLGYVSQECPGDIEQWKCGFNC